MKTVYLDTETTGLDPSRDELLEIAIVNDPGIALVDTLIRPQRCQQWRLAQRIHGIAPEDVRDAPALEDVLAEVVSAVTGARLVIYNADFDLGFLPNEVLIAAADIVCCMDAFAEEYGEYSEYLGEYRRQSLAIAADYVGHQWQGHGHHRALADALACRDVWRFITGSASYRAEVEARRMEVARRAEVTRHIAEALSRYDRQIAQSQADRWLAAQRRAHQVIQRFFLRQTAPRHWLSLLPPDQARTQLAVVFLGLPDDLPPECYSPGVEIQAIYRRLGDIPDRLVAKNWFPNLSWVRALLTPVAAFTGPRSARALYDKGQLDAIQAEYWPRFATLPERPCTVSELRSEGYSREFIDSLTPAAESYNRQGHFWYPIYDRDALGLSVDVRC
ncbi:DNA polymerase III epsilon subunit-like protein [Modicisalibacter xianhensis]|uniref:DNA polymerase III epsilon subunit-like protein n=1 Tax=Modicisalibacter xianhensis TaxID=442341 RepID=A0A4R8F8R9_9GAMM|nr:3'-5' exonuclease [Halomonas xianhensis]TDX21849.1 DNA polymerase III epsilon subunit-like protein [Halomonas xianhensis]